MPGLAKRTLGYRCACLAAACIASVSLMAPKVVAQSAVPGASAPPATAPAGALPPGWDEVDQRLVFLTVELSGVETSLNAVDKAIRVSGSQQAAKQRQADTYRKGNELMDRNAGGPVPWNQFYGRTAQSFFYHPTRKSVYINPTPIPQRPPQLDYIYRANSDNQQRAEAEASAMGNQIDRLLTRRRQLEGEQEALWCKIALRALASRDLMRKPLYAFEPSTNSRNGDAALHEQRLAAIRSGAQFMRAIDRATQLAKEDVDRDPTTAFQQLEHTTAAARETLSTDLLRQPLLLKESQGNETSLAKFSKAAGQMEDCALNVRDAARGVDQSEKSGDEFRKQELRGQIQQNLIRFAELALVADQELSDLAKTWGVEPDPTKLVRQPPEMKPSASATADRPASSATPAPMPASENHATVNPPATTTPPPTTPSRALAGIDFKNPAHAPEGERVLADLREQNADAFVHVKAVTLVQYHDATEMKRHFGKPEKFAQSFSDQVVVGEGRNMMLYGVSDNLPSDHYLIVFRVQALTTTPPGSADHVCFLDVAIRGKTAASAHPTREQFKPGQWSNIPVVANLRQSRYLEYRLWPDGHKIALDRIYVFRLDTKW